MIGGVRLKNWKEMKKNRVDKKSKVELPLSLRRKQRQTFVQYVALVLSYLYLFSDPGHRFNLIGIWCGAGRFELKES